MSGGGVEYAVDISHSVSSLPCLVELPGEERTAKNQVKSAKKWG